MTARTLPRIAAPVALLLVTASMIILSACISAKCRPQTTTPLLEIHYVYDPIGGAPMISTASFFPCDVVELKTIGSRPRSKQLASKQIPEVRRVLDDEKFWQLLARLEQEYKGPTGVHGSFIALATAETRIDQALPRLQVPHEDIPPDLLEYLETLQESIVATFPRTAPDLLRPRIGR